MVMVKMFNIMSMFNKIFEQVLTNYTLNIMVMVKMVKDGSSS